MLDELRPKGLKEAALSLGVEPFEVVRLLIAADAVPPGAMRLDDELLGTLREVGGIEASWWAGDDELPEDDDPRRARVRAALGALLAREIIGDATTRLDNVWRGLSPDDQLVLQAAFTALAEDGLLALLATPVGLKVAVVAGKQVEAQTIVDGSGSSASLDALLQA
jgi:hypothetical protein